MQFVEDARQFWRWWSVRLAFVAGIVGAYFATNDGRATLEMMLAWVPDSLRPPLVFFIMAVLPTLVRTIQQKPKDQTNG